MSALRLILPLLCGALFGAGLLVAGMTDPAKVRGFLDVFGAWDPTLAFVMGGAVAVAAIVARDMPSLAVPALGIAALMSGVQVPRARHYPVDVAAGAALGLAAAWLVSAMLPAPQESRPKEENHVG